MIKRKRRINLDFTSIEQNIYKNNIIFVDEYFFKDEKHSKLVKKLKKINFSISNKNIVLYNDSVFAYINRKTDLREFSFKLLNYILDNTKFNKINLNFDYFNTNVSLNKDNKFNVFEIDNIIKILEGFYFCSYDSDQHKSNDKNKVIKSVLINIYSLIHFNNISTNQTNTYNQILEEFQFSKNLIDAQFFTRDLVNSPSNIANPDTIESYLLQEFKYSLQNNTDNNIEITVYDENRLKEEKMEGHLSVNQGSDFKARTIKIVYTPKTGEYNKTIVFVGKGLTYDSGGLSLKPTDSMVDMKTDKAGAMTVAGIMKAIKDLNNSENRIIAYIALAENVINSNSYKPGDILTMKNGKTVRILNTDAEGRLVLFDNLSLAESEYGEDINEIYSIATLTGAAIAQFGEETSALVGFNNKLKKKLIKIGKEENELFINAEFNKYMLNSVNDPIADLRNTYDNRYMGCQKAGLFLTNALSKKIRKKYVHIDIAGPAYINKEFSINKKGATGETVRSLVKRIIDIF